MEGDRSLSLLPGPVPQAGSLICGTLLHYVLARGDRIQFRNVAAPHTIQTPAATPGLSPGPARQRASVTLQ